MPKADEIVAARIIEELGRKGLVPPEKLAGLGRDLAHGSVSAEDWAFMAEHALDESVGGVPTASRFF